MLVVKDFEKNGAIQVCCTSFSSDILMMLASMSDNYDGAVGYYVCYLAADSNMSDVFVLLASVAGPYVAFTGYIV